MEKEKKIFRIEVADKFPSSQEYLESLLKRSKIKAKIRKSVFYKIETQNYMGNALELGKLFTDPVLQDFYTGPYSIEDEIEGALTVGFLPGVTDNTGRALEEALQLEGVSTTCFSGEIYFIHGMEGVATEAFEVLKSEVGNGLIQEVSFIDKKSLLRGDRFNEIKLPTVNIEHEEIAETIDFNISDDELLNLSKERCLALNLEELKAIQSHYEDTSVKERRKALGLTEKPTDVEIEVLAQTWSEHCKHKIFAAKIDYTNAVTQETETIDSLYKTFIKKATKEIEEQGVDWLISVFSDNAGIVRFDSKIDLCIKVETHNSPSALDPYGGAITGILGVNRDILGCGLGAKPIANTDVFCFASTELPKKVDPLKLPLGLMEPKKLLRGVHKGVEDGGNKSGIPTINGAIVFDLDFAGKPLVFCGTVGTLPQKLSDGREGKEKGAKTGDQIFVLGGAVGADGIHGATFSSMELNEDSPATAVQIGDPITQKRVMDFLLKARDKGLYTCVTDNGAGGISSSIGEMAELTGGANIDLDKHPRKYPGLSPWEIMISESQERMTVAVDPKNKEEFQNLAVSSGVDASCLGEFTDSGGLDIFYKEKRVAWLPMKFLHEGVPTLKLKAIGNKESSYQSWIKVPKKEIPKSYNDILLALLNSENISSKEYWVRQYDHEVQGATIGKPFPGVNGITPGDSGCIDLEIHGGESNSMIAVGCGLAPRWSIKDANLMAKLAVDEAVRNVVASGVNPEKICLLDNFCWPDPVVSEKNPYGEEKLGQLVDSCKGLYEICKLYKTPLVSGKDSMKNDFRGKNRAGEDLTISIKPTLLVTAMGHGKKTNIKRSSVSQGVFKFYHFGKPQLSLQNSECHEIFGDQILEKGVVSLDKSIVDFKDWDFKECLKQYMGLYQLIEKGLIANVHDISDGGLLCALSEMLFDHGLGFSGTLPENLITLFGEGPGQFVVSIEKRFEAEFERFCSEVGISFKELGSSNDSGRCSFYGTEKTEIQIDELLESWQRDWS